MAHSYVCRQCGRKRRCSIKGCRGSQDPRLLETEKCVDVCVSCLRGKSQKPLPPILTAIVVDPFGWSGATAEEEVESHRQYFTDFLRRELNAYAPKAFYPSEIKVGTEFVVFDYGGVGPGSSLLSDNSRRLVEWARDNPSALVYVASRYTWASGVKYEVEDLLRRSGDRALDECRLDDEEEILRRQFPNLVYQDWRRDGSDNDAKDRIRAWFNVKGEAPQRGPRLAARLISSRRRRARRR